MDGERGGAFLRFLRHRRTQPSLPKNSPLRALLRELAHHLNRLLVNRLACVGMEGWVSETGVCARTCHTHKVIKRVFFEGQASALDRKRQCTRARAQAVDPSPAYAPGPDHSGCMLHPRARGHQVLSWPCVLWREPRVRVKKPHATPLLFLIILVHTSFSRGRHGPAAGRPAGGAGGGGGAQGCLHGWRV